MEQIVAAAAASEYDGVELRFVEGEASLWKLAAFQGTGLAQSARMLSDAGLEVCCVSTSCRFDSPDANERERWVEEGVRMAELAASLSAPGMRVFGDRIQPGIQRDITRKWIMDSLNALVEKVRSLRVAVWLETHGDFCRAADVQAVLADCNRVGLVWDAASAFVVSGERPIDNGMTLRSAIRHVHIKDLRKQEAKWVPALTGNGQFPLCEIRTVIEKIGYAGFLSFEWEKKWHPEIEPPEVAIPHFARWFREKWSVLGTAEGASVSGGGE